MNFRDKFNEIMNVGNSENAELLLLKDSDFHKAKCEKLIKTANNTFVTKFKVYHAARL